MKPGSEPAKDMTTRQLAVLMAMEGLLAARFGSAMGDSLGELSTLAIDNADACLKREQETREEANPGGPNGTR